MICDDNQSQALVDKKMFCTKCGSMISEGDNFCRNCGVAIQLPENEASESPTDMPVAEDTETIVEGNGQEIQDVQMPKKVPIVTGLLTMLIVACSGWVFWRTNSLTDVSAVDLLKYGGNFKSLTFAGEEWRLWSSTFLHGGVIHLLTNMLCLCSFGPLLERLCGHVKFLSLYVIAALGSSVVSMKFNGDVVSIGASGAIFGIFGSLMVYVVIMKNRFGLTTDSVWTYLKDGMIFGGVNLIYSLQPGIDMSAHLGGLLYGALAGLFIALVDCVGSKALSFLLNCVLIVLCAIIITGMTCSWIDSDSWICSDSENYPFEFALNLPAAEKGDAVAQLNIGLMYYNGQGVEQDYAEAAKWWRKAADQGDEAGQYNLGLMYYNGQGVEQDYAEAVKWYSKAADQGYAGAQNNLGVCYANGQGVQLDYEMAVSLYRKAADQGDAIAQNNLGIMYADGQGVERNYEEAVKWWRKAADHGCAGAQYNLGVSYDKGRGVGRDSMEAVKWWRKAAEQGHADAQNILGAIGEILEK